MSTPEAEVALKQWADRARAEVEWARAVGVTGVPFLVFDQRLTVSGAHPVEVSRRAVDQKGVRWRRTDVVVLTGFEPVTSPV